MISYADGTIDDTISVAGNPMYPAYIVRSKGANLLIDAGVDVLGRFYLERLDEVLGSREKLDYLFVTHSHYDHLGAVSYLKRKIPGLQFGAHPRIDALLRKESVIAWMQALGEHQRRIFPNLAEEDGVRLGPAAVDLFLQDGDRIDLGGLTLEVHGAPGHTRDSLAFFLKETGVLFAGEALGIPLSGEMERVQVEFVSSYEDYVATIDRLAALRPRMICLGHGWVLTGADADAYFETTRASTAPYKALIESYLDRAGGDIVAATVLMAREQYDDTETVYQERNAYLANLRGQVGLVARMRAAQPPSAPLSTPPSSGLSGK